MCQKMVPESRVEMETGRRVERDQRKGYMKDDSGKIRLGRKGVPRPSQAGALDDMQ